MPTPAKSFSLDASGRALVVSTSRSKIAHKLFQNTSFEQGVRVLLETGETGLKRRKLLIRNWSGSPLSHTVYIGDADVDAADGYPLHLDDEIELNVDLSVDVYAWLPPKTQNGGIVFSAVAILELE